MANKCEGSLERVVETWCSPSPFSDKLEYILALCAVGKLQWKKNKTSTFVKSGLHYDGEIAANNAILSLVGLYITTEQLISSVILCSLGNLICPWGPVKKTFVCMQL